MKKYTFIFLLCNFWLTSNAQPGSLLVSSSNNQRFWLFIDDVLQNEYSIPSIRVQGMQPQRYKLHIEMDNVNANCVGQIITLPRQGDSYMISSRNNAYSLNRTHSNVRPTLVMNLIQPNYNYYHDYQQYLYPGFGNPGNYWQGTGNNHGKPYQNNQHSGSSDYHGGGAGYAYGSPCRNPREFSIALSSISSISFESGKLQFAKDMTASGPICVEQIIQVCRTFSFESTKLEYTKFAYAYCTDKNVYYLVDNVFDYQSSKDELSRFVR